MNQETPFHAAPANRGQCQTITLLDKIGLIQGYWKPHVVAEMNDYQFKVVQIEGAFDWHQHGSTDETFIVLEGTLHIDYRDPQWGIGTLVLRAGEMAVVPQGVEHLPRAIGIVKMLLIEPRGVINTGDGDKTARTAENDRWI